MTSGYQQFDDTKMRLAELEKAMRDIAVSIANISASVDKLTDIEARLRSVEQQTSNNVVVINSVKWLTVTILGSALTIIVYTIVERISSALGA